jgi:deoxyribonuclease-2
MNISALDENRSPVDWWFAYKLPGLPNLKFDPDPNNSVGEAQGTEYLYCDATNPALPTALSPHPKILESGALVSTIQQLHKAVERHDPGVGWFCYNDEHPKLDYTPIPCLPADNWEFGHTKGVLAFDLRTDTAFWMLHSWPCYPSISITPVATPSPLFGQTFLCISLKDVTTADAIAKVFHVQSQPQITDMNLPGTIDVKKYPHLVQLATDMPRAVVSTTVPLGSSKPSVTTFKSKKGTKFHLFAKSKDWIDPATDKTQAAKDLYSDLIGPKLGVDLEVETWQDGEQDQDSDLKHTTQDIQWIDLRALGLNYAWHFLNHDHAKWAVSMDLDKQKETDWVIVADINRIQSQYKRGGVGIAFQNQALAHSLHSIIRMVPPPGNPTATDPPSTQVAA